MTVYFAVDAVPAAAGVGPAVAGEDAAAAPIPAPAPAAVVFAPSVATGSRMWSANAVWTLLVPSVERGW
ncbi:MAG: hypothetical protein JW850_18075 [Thermoflexales bacterium]|nr:hypothetical protein [Thermoflexales bacterium]